MEWIIIGLVPVLIIAWKYLYTKSKPPLRHVMTDVRGSLADRLQLLAADAREENHHDEAQQLEYQAKWLRTRPTDIGGDDVPEELLPEEERHVRFAGAIWDEYGTFLAETADGSDEGQFKPQSTLPYTKEGIAVALQLLLDIGEGRVSSAFIDSRSIPPEGVENLRQALGRLADFVEGPSADEA
jgi:hypothetical protein